MVEKQRYQIKSEGLEELRELRNGKMAHFDAHEIKIGHLEGMKLFKDKIVSFRIDALRCELDEGDAMKFAETAAY